MKREATTSLTLGAIERACFRLHKMLAEFVWDASCLEGNPFTFTEVQTIIAGVTVGGHRISDQQQVLNLVESSRRLLAMVRGESFSLSKLMACEFHALVTQRESPEPGHFRGKAANDVFYIGVTALNEQVDSAYERACAYFLFGSLQQFFVSGNKRTSRFMMNGVLMANGIDAICIPAARAEEFKEKIASFHLTRDGSEMMAMLWSCHPAS